MLGYRGRGTPSEEPESEEEELDDVERELSFMEQAVAWRAVKLLDLGFTLPQVLKLVHTADVVHDAEKLIAAGCPVDIAFDLLT